MKSVCDHKNQLVTELLDFYSMRYLSEPPVPMGLDERAEHMDAIQAAIQQASKLTNMLGGGFNPNQLMRHVSSVGEHVSSSFTVTSIANRAETFAGFDTKFELSKGDNSTKRLGSHLMDVEDEQLDSDSELFYDQQSQVYNDSNDSVSCNYDNTTVSVMEAYPSQLPVYLAGDQIRQLSTSLNNIVHLTSKYGTEVESLKAQLAEANERINKLSADVFENRGGSYKHHKLEELRNLQDKVQWEKAMDFSIQLALLEEQLEKDKAYLATKTDELKRQEAIIQKQSDLWQKNMSHRDFPIEKIISAPGMVVLKKKESLEGTSSTDPRPTSYPDSPNQNTHRRSPIADFCSTKGGDLEMLRLGHVKTWRELCLRDDQTRESGICVTPSFCSSVSSKLVGNKNKQLPVHLLSAKNEQKKSASLSQLSQSVESGKRVQQVLPFKLADATGGISSTQARPPPKSGSHIKEEGHNISGSLQLSKEISQSIVDRIHEQERIQRLREIHEGFDPRSTTQYKCKKFKTSDIRTHGRKLVKEGKIGFKSARGKVTEATMVVLTDLIFFMQEQHAKYTFFSQDNKYCAIPLFELLVFEKSDTKESKGIYLISQNKDTPKVYKIVCNTNSEKEAWIREIRAASEKCLPEDEMQPKKNFEEERRQMMKGSNKIREIIGMF